MEETNSFPLTSPEILETPANQCPEDMERTNLQTFSSSERLETPTAPTTELVHFARQELEDRFSI